MSGLSIRVATQAEADKLIPLTFARPAAFYGLLATPTEPLDIARFLRMGSCCECGMERGKSTGCQPKTDKKGREVGWIRCRLGTRRLNFVTVLGSATPLHPDWVRSIRDQCEAAKVPFRFEGWGEWCPRESPYVIDDDVPRVRLTICGCNGQSDIARHGVRGSYTSAHECDTSNDSWMNKVGPARAGRLLDGVTHDGCSHD